MKRSLTRRNVLSLATGVAGVSMLAPLIGQGSPEQAVATSGVTMGTTYRLTLPRLPEGISIEKVADETRRVFDRVDFTMSTYRADSDVSRFNRSAAGEWLTTSTETSEVVAAALGIAERTKGAFDPTVGRAVDLWGFGPAGPSFRVPTPEAVGVTRRGIGFSSLEVRRDPPALRKRREELHIDLSGIAEGYALDQLAASLESLGLRDFLIELGGELVARGRNLEGRRWVVGVDAPDSAHDRWRRRVALDGKAIATSGDYRKFFMAGGRRYSHVIDPRSGKPVDHDLAAVTVIDNSSMRADALATALLVMGPEAGREFGTRCGIAALFLTRGASGFIEYMTDLFAGYLLESVT